VPEVSIKALSVVLLTTTALTVGASLSAAPHGLHAMAFRGAVLGTIALFIGLLTLSMVWKMRARRVLLDA
jgi:hypothetical protein